MGAATSLMFGVSDPSVACMVLDSPFSSLKVLANELVSKNEVKIPKMVVSVAFKMLKKSIEKKAGFDIEKLEPVKSAPKCFIPALFAHANDDDFIDLSHSKTLSGKYGGDFNLITFEGDHTSIRPGFFYDSVCIFFNNNLNVTSDFGDENPYVQDELKEEDFAEVTHSFKKPKSYNDELERVKQISIKDAHSIAPKSQQEEDELLEMALKLSLLETEGKKPETTDDKDKLKNSSSDKDKVKNSSNDKDKEAKDKEVKEKDNNTKDTKEKNKEKVKSKSQSKKNASEDEKMVGLDTAEDTKVKGKGSKKSGTKKKK